MKKTILALALALGATSAAFAEDSSSSFAQNVYGQIGHAGETQTFQSRNVGLTTRNVALPQGQATYGAQQNVTGYDRASSSYGGSSF